MTRARRPAADRTGRSAGRHRRDRAAVRARPGAARAGRQRPASRRLRPLTPSPTATAAAGAGTVTPLGRMALLQHPDPDARATRSCAWRGRLQLGVRRGLLAVAADPTARDRAAVLAVPPCGHVAGIVARSDRPSARTSRPPTRWSSARVGLTRRVDDADHGGERARGQRDPGRPRPRDPGARRPHPQPRLAWRYVNVRRLVTQIERSVAAYAAWLVFEPNDRGPARRRGARRPPVPRRALARRRARRRAPPRRPTACASTTPRPRAGRRRARWSCEIGLQPPYPGGVRRRPHRRARPGAAEPHGGGGAGGGDRLAGPTRSWRSASWSALDDLPVGGFSDCSGLQSRPSSSTTPRAGSTTTSSASPAGPGSRTWCSSAASSTASVGLVRRPGPGRGAVPQRHGARPRPVRDADRPALRVPAGAFP